MEAFGNIFGNLPMHRIAICKSHQQAVEIPILWNAKFGRAVKCII